MAQPTLTADGRPIRYGAYPELTWPAVIVGWMIGALITVSVSYATLILGFSIEGTELAAILGWGILRGILRRSSIIENNINQTVACAVNSASAGMMFTIPALFILQTNFPDRYAGIAGFNRTLVVLGCIAGGMLGLAFVIPIRKQMIDFNRLAYPGGVATAAILKSPGAGLKKALQLLSGIAIAATASILTLIAYSGHEGEWHVGQWLGLPTYLNITFAVSLMTAGVGYISGRHGLVFGYGGFLCYFLLAPLLSYFGSPDVREMIVPQTFAAEQQTVMTPDELAKADEAVPTRLRLQLFRPTGIGILIGAAIGGIIAALPLIISAVRSMQSAAKERGGVGSDEMPIHLLYLAVVGSALALIVIAYNAVEGMTLFTAAMTALVGTAWIWIAGVIVSECLGRTNWSPLSGMTLIAVTILIVACKQVSGLADAKAIVASMIVGAAVCVAIAQAGGLMLDLKAGYLVGAVPRRQQYAQYMGNWLGPIIVMAVTLVLHQAYTLGSEKLPAAQATALATTANSIVGGDAPTWRYAAGAGIGLLLALSGLGGIGVQIGLGFYMPFTTVLTYTIGCLTRMAIDRGAGHRAGESGIPFAAGLIVGESLVGVGNAIYVIATKLGSN